MAGDEIGGGAFGEGEGVQEEEAEDDDDGGEDAPPEFLVHHRFHGLFALEEVFHGVVEAVERPDVKGGESAGEREDDEQDERARVVGCDGEGGDGVDDAEDEMRHCEEADVDHRFAEGGLDDAITHADDEEQEEGE